MKYVIAWAQAFALSIGGLGLFFVAFIDASVLSLPEVNDILIVYMVTKSPSFLLVLRGDGDGRVDRRLAGGLLPWPEGR